MDEKQSPKKFQAGSDKESVNRFWQDAVSIFETASSAPRDGGELNILIDDRGGLQIVAAEGWRPEALAAHYGPRTVYQVSQTADGVRVTGRSMGASCVLQTAKPAGTLPGTIRRLDGPVCF